MKKMLNLCRLRLKSEQFWLWVMLLLLVLALYGVATYQIIALLVVGAVFRFFWTHIMGAENWKREALRTLVYVGVITLFIYMCGVDLVFSTSGFAGTFGVLLRAVLGVILAAWLTPIICSKIGNFFGQALYGFGGRGEKVEKTFLSSIAEGFRKRGMYQEALDNIESQLRDIPNSFEGKLLKAAIFADDLKDVARAEEVVNEMLSQSSLDPKLGALIYNRLADWRLVHLRNLEGAKEALQAIVDRYPGSEAASFALQRKSRLCLPNEGTPETKKVIRIVEDLGLVKGFKGWDMPEVTWQEEVAQLAQFLEDHPHDWDAHEKLASIYSRDCQDVRAAVAQLEMLLEIPEQPKKKVAQWLNMEADFYIRAHDLSGAKTALERIIKRYPESAPANMAQNRISLLKMELEKEAASTYIVPETDPSLAKFNDKKIAKVVRDTYAKRAQVNSPGPIKPEELTLSGSESSSQKGEETKEDDKLWVKEMEKLDEHLAQHPADWESREELAALYAYQCGEVNAAIAQMEVMINTPGETPSKIAKWLNREADFFLNAQDLESAKAALKRIGTLNPESPFVPLAERRIMRLKLEMGQKQPKKFEVPKWSGFEANSADNFAGDRIVKAVRDTRAKLNTQVTKEPQKSNPLKTFGSIKVHLEKEDEKK